MRWCCVECSTHTHPANMSGGAQITTKLKGDMGDPQLIPAVFWQKRYKSLEILWKPPQCWRCYYLHLCGRSEVFVKTCQRMFIWTGIWMKVYINLMLANTWHGKFDRKEDGILAVATEWHSLSICAGNLFFMFCGYFKNSGKQSTFLHFAGYWFMFTQILILFRSRQWYGIWLLET